MDKKSFVPSMHRLKDLVDECKRIERTETPANNDNDDNNKNTKKSSWRNLTTTKKMAAARMNWQQTENRRTGAWNILILIVAGVALMSCTTQKIVSK